MAQLINIQVTVFFTDEEYADGTARKRVDEMLAHYGDMLPAQETEPSPWRGARYLYETWERRKDSFFGAPEWQWFVTLKANDR